MKHKKHTAFAKQFLAALLITLLSVTGAFPAANGAFVQPVYAAQQSEGPTTFVTHNRKENAFTLSLRDGALFIDSFPSVDGYRYAMVQFKNVTAKIFPIAEPQPLPLPEKDGTYRLYISLGKEHAGSYPGFVENLAVTVRDGEAFFAKSPVYDWNLKLQKKAKKLKAPDWYYTLQTFLTYFQTPADKKAFEKKIKKQAQEIVDADDSDYVKIRKVHDWVASNIWYDHDGLALGVPHTDEKGVLDERRAVCEGYANLTAALLRSLGIPAKVITGQVTYVGWNADGTPKDDLSGHAWNEAYADGRWIILDTTWDSGNSYRGGKFSEKSAARSTYFDPTLALFSQNHKAEGDFQKSRRESEIWENGLSLSAYSLTLMTGQSKKLTVRTKPAMSYINLKKDAKITFSSSNKKVATVSKKGVVKAKKEGTAIITTKIKIADAVIEIETDVWVPL